MKPRQGRQAVSTSLDDVSAGVPEPSHVLAQAIGDGIVVADAAAKAQHIGPTGGLLLGGSRVLRQSGARRSGK
jgi:hypothetical protein